MRQLQQLDSRIAEPWLHWVSVFPSPSTSIIMYFNRVQALANWSHSKCLPHYLLWNHVLVDQSWKEPPQKYLFFVASSLVKGVWMTVWWKRNNVYKCSIVTSKDDCFLYIQVLGVAILYRPAVWTSHTQTFSVEFHKLLNIVNVARRRLHHSR